MNDLMEKFLDIYSRDTIPDCSNYMRLLERVNEQLENEDEDIRPKDDNNRPGGFLNLNKDIPTILVPDLHARMEYFINLMFCCDPDGVSILEKIVTNSIQMVCLGDGFHSETNSRRWAAALEEYKEGYGDHRNMDNEMRESLGVMEMVMELKCAHPHNFHFLKGNHENISNERGEGNFPFRKYALEGSMVLEYLKMFFGDEFLNRFYNFEKKLPILAAGESFLVSHSEPKTYFSRESVINYRDNPDVIRGLTWTANDEAHDGSVAQMLNEYFDTRGDVTNYFYFGGHRSVKGLYNLRANGRYVQLHNVRKYILAVFKDTIHLDEDIDEISDRTDEILSFYKLRDVYA